MQWIISAVASTLAFYALTSILAQIAQGSYVPSTDQLFTWHAAYMHCLDKGMRLAQPKNKTEIAEIYSVANETGTTYYWLGLFQRPPATKNSIDQWYYVDGNRFAFGLDEPEYKSWEKPNIPAIKLWTLGEPDDSDYYFEEQHRQDCALLDGNASMNDFECHLKFPAMCEEAACGVAGSSCCKNKVCDGFLNCVKGKCVKPPCGLPGMKCCKRDTPNAPQTLKDGCVAFHRLSCVDNKCVTCHPFEGFSARSGECRRISSKNPEPPSQDDTNVTFTDLNQSLRFPQAYFLCLSQGAILPRPETRAEGAALRRAQRNQKYQPPWASVFQVPDQKFIDTGWIFGDGQPVPLDKWRDGQPSDRNVTGFNDGENSDQDCAVVPRRGTFNYRTAQCINRFPTLCQSAQCGSLDLKCCDGRSCEYGLTCKKGTCKLGCGLAGYGCCGKSDSAPCLPGLVCSKGVCTDCLASPGKVLDDGRCVSHPYTYLFEKTGPWLQAYTQCAMEGKRLLSLASDREISLVNIFMRQLVVNPRSVHVNNPEYVAENSAKSKTYLESIAVPGDSRFYTLAPTPAPAPVTVSYPPPSYNEFYYSYSYPSPGPDAYVPDNTGYEAPAPGPEENIGRLFRQEKPEPEPVVPVPNLGWNYCLNRLEVSLCRSSVDDIICQTGSCGVLGGDCCSDSKCDLGLECVDGECKLGCGLLNQPCCKDGRQCLFGAACDQGVCQSCPPGTLREGDQCIDSGYLLTNRADSWAATYQQCLDMGLVLAQPKTPDDRQAIVRSVPYFSDVWIGGYQQDTADTITQGWVWVDDTAVEKGWRKEQPFDSRRFVEDEKVRKNYDSIDLFEPYNVGLPHMVSNKDELLEDGDYPGAFDSIRFGNECLRTSKSWVREPRYLVSSPCEQRSRGLCQTVQCGSFGKKCCQGNFCYAGLTCGSENTCQVGCGLRDQKCCAIKQGLGQQCLGELICQGGICKSCRYDDGLKIVNGTCVPAVGDLLIDMDNLDMFLQQVPAYLDPCVQESGCLGSSEGLRWVLRFSLQVKNIGEGDVVVGRPPVCPNDFEDIQSSNLFTFDTCNWEWSPANLLALALDRLNNTSQKMLYNVANYSTSLSLQDEDCWIGSERYTFSHQGVSRGCWDEFGSSLRCFWIDVTDEIENLDSIYRLKVLVNNNRTIQEENYDNNVAQITFRMGNIRQRSSIDFGYVPYSSCSLVDKFGSEAPPKNPVERKAAINDAQLAEKQKQMNLDTNTLDAGVRGLRYAQTAAKHSQSYTLEERQRVANAIGELLSPCPQDRHVYGGCVLPSWEQ